MGRAKEKAESQEVLSGKVTEAVKGGVIVLYNGSRIFIPASQATATREESLEDLVGQDVDFRLIEVSQNGRRRRAYRFNPQRTQGAESLLSVKNSGKPAKLASVTRALLSHLQATAHLLTSAACSA